MIADGHIYCLAAAVCWVALAVAVGLLPRRFRVQATWLSALLGVPLIGWMTYEWGPGPGMAMFLLGVLILLRGTVSTRGATRARAAVPAPVRGPARARASVPAPGSTDPARPARRD